MGVDIYASRRSYYEKCLWYERDESADPRNLVAVKEPSGVFYASEANAEYAQDQLKAGAFMVDSSTVTLKTNDSVDGMKTEDLVEYSGRIWIVDGVQRVKRKKRSEFSREPQYSSYISLRGV